MQLGPESERPKKAVATPPGQPTLHVPVTDDEWREMLQRDEEHNRMMAERAATQYKMDREEAYKAEIYPLMDEARMNSGFGDDTLLNALKKKKEEIDARFPESA